MKNKYIGPEMPIMGGWAVCRFKKGLAKNKKLMSLKWGSNPNAHYELEEPSYWHKYPKQITL